VTGGSGSSPGIDRIGQQTNKLRKFRRSK